LHLILRILVGWCGVSLIVGGLWIVLAASKVRLDRQAVIVAGAFLSIGAALLWAALNLL